MTRLRKKMMIFWFVLANMATAIPTFAATITSIEAQPSGTSVTLTSNPVVYVIGSAPGTVDGYTYTSYSIFVEDGTGSIILFGTLPAGDLYVPAVGDKIDAAGTYSPYDFSPEIGTLTSLTQVSSGNSVPGPVPVTITQFASITTSSYNYLGYYLQLQNVEFSGATGNFPTHANATYTLTDPSGNNPLKLFLWANSYSSAGALGGTPIPTGAVDIDGFVDFFNGTSEFVPFSISAATAATPEPTSLGLLLSGIAALGLLRRRRIAT